ncbi:MAG: DUF1080 domain-containing protein [Ignavibacteriales bacterium]|nr:DUF1080 domain-containing protein [Ignavibacteriales bacterium]MCB9218263.1 DUF1080 domain-containing protein [Ignavibacteriales bacterium]
MENFKKSKLRNSLIVVFVIITAFLSYQCLGEEEGDPKLSEVWDPVPKIVTPGENNTPPSDAIILFDGTNFNEWETTDGAEPKWQLVDGAMTVVKKTGSIKTKKSFGDCQLHIEWRTPAKVEGEGQGRGNSGIFLQERYEVQVLDSYNNVTYSNGQAGSIYKQFIPMVNACRPPGVWQTYDIFFNAPKFNEDGTVEVPGFVTVVQNGVLVQNHVELQGPTAYIGKPTYETHNAKEPISLQDHGNPVSYRNIWIREL